jgi:membrane associated rhomboid family serine protease
MAKKVAHSGEARGWKARFAFMVGFVVLLWAVEVLNLLTGNSLTLYGIHPRTLAGLWGVLFAPFLHASVPHLLMNTVPLLVLGLLVMRRGLSDFLEVSLVVVIGGGAGVWIFASSGNHVGASGLIFGYFGYLLARAWYQRDLLSILVALLVVFLYGGMLWGILPLRAHVSWEGHLFGLLAGVGAGWMEKKSA